MHIYKIILQHTFSSKQFPLCKWNDPELEYKTSSHCIGSVGVTVGPVPKTWVKLQQLNNPSKIHVYHTAMNLNIITSYTSGVTHPNAEPSTNSMCNALGFCIFISWTRVVNERDAVYCRITFEQVNIFYNDFFALKHTHREHNKF